MRRAHLIVGLAGVIVFLLTGQVMSHHHPKMTELPAEVRMMFVSRHIYLLGASLVNVTLGLYLQERAPAWRRLLQWIGSALILFAPVSLLMAFLAEPRLGLAGRGWRTYIALLGLFSGVLLHVVAGRQRIDTSGERP